MTALSELLAAANTQAWSTREIARRAEKNGHMLAQPTVSKYIGGRHGRPTEAVLAAFSDVLKIPIDELREAAGVPAGAESPWTPPSEANRLDLRQRRALEELIRSMVASEITAEDRTDDEQDPAGVERDAQPDGVTPRTGQAAARAKWDAARRAAFAGRTEDTSTGGPDAGKEAQDLDRAPAGADDRPWEQDEYGLAAKRGRNRGRETRQHQDREAEDGGA